MDLSSYNLPLPENIQFNNGGDLYLNSYNVPLPENIQFNNGGNVKLKGKTINVNTSYLKRFKINIENENIILYKKVSNEFKTQEKTSNETIWTVGTEIEHPNWNPLNGECGEGKFHACAKPFWCDVFRQNKKDKYIAIQVNIKDIHEWKDNPSYPQKIGFRKGKILSEVSRLS